MGSQFNSEFTLSSRCCSYLSCNDVTSSSISSAVFRRSLPWPLNPWGHIVVTPGAVGDRRLTSLSWWMCSVSSGEKVPDLFYEHMHTHSTDEWRDAYSILRAYSKYLQLSPTFTFCEFWSSRFHLWRCRLSRRTCNYVQLLVSLLWEQRVVDSAVYSAENNLLVFEVLRVVFARTLMKRGTKTVGAVLH